MSTEQIEYLKAQVKLYREKFETVQPLVDCRVCDHYGPDMYYPCKATVECYRGGMWTRTKVIQLFDKAPNVDVTGAGKRRDSDA